MANSANYSFFINHVLASDQVTVWWNDTEWLSNAANFNFDIDGPDFQYDELTVQEKVLVKTYPMQAFVIKQNISVAKNMSTLKFGFSGSFDNVNDKKNAFLHAFFNAINTRDVPAAIYPFPLTGSAIVKLFSTEHESEVPLQLNLKRQMDLYNNPIGINYCWNCWVQSNSAIADALMIKVWNRELKYISNLDFVQSPKFPLGNNGITANSHLIWTNQ